MLDQTVSDTVRKEVILRYIYIMRIYLFFWPWMHVNLLLETINPQNKI